GDQSFEQGNILFPLLKQLGVYDDLHFLRAWYRLKTPNIDVQIRTPDDLPGAFARAFPEHADATHAFFGALNRDLDHLRPIFREDNNPMLQEGISSLAAVARLSGHIALNAPRLWRLLHTRGSTQAADFYAPGSEVYDFFQRMGYRNMSLFVWVGFLYAWQHDYWYPVGGIQTLFDRLAVLVRDLGGELYYKRAVTAILTEGKRSLRASGVRTAKGDMILAPHVIYTGDMKALYRFLLADHGSLAAIRPRIMGGSLSEALTSVYLGLDIPPQQVRDCLQTHHTFYFPSYSIHDPHALEGADLHGRAWVEISCPVIDPENESLAPPGQSVIVLQTMVRAAWLNRWQTLGASDKRAYRALKGEVVAQMVATLNQVLPGASDHILYSDVGSALSASRFTRNSAGATAGWTFDPHASPLRNRFLSLRTPIEGLVTAGHYAIWPGGVPMAALSGRLAADRVLGKPLGKALHLLEGLLPLPAFPPDDDPGVTDLPDPPTRGQTL
ncbi:MAG TPA: FAD-dependent oxidoreductase, partial [Aggregatilineales bacterium]|nr:FAD-dependent oxidoreductase [Aggregatilineales bacterium]